MRALAENWPEVPEGDRLDVTLPCASEDCDRKVRIVAEGRMPEFSVRMAHRLAAGELPALCDPCIDRLDEQDEQREQALLRQRNIATRIERAGIPPRWQEASFGELERDPGRLEAIEAATQWAAGHGSLGVLLHGEVGRGKSHIAAAAALGRCALGNVRWLNVAELLAHLAMPFDHPWRERAVRLIGGPARCALVLDDFDKARGTEFSIEPLYLAVNAWTEAQQPLFVTMNRDLDTLEETIGERYGAAIASRLAGYCEQHHVGGDDWRQK